MCKSSSPQLLSPLANGIKAGDLSTGTFPLWYGFTPALQRQHHFVLVLVLGWLLGLDRQTDLLDICYSSIAPSALVIFWVNWSTVGEGLVVMRLYLWCMEKLECWWRILSVENWCTWGFRTVEFSSKSVGICCIHGFGSKNSCKKLALSGYSTTPPLPP